MSFQSLSKDTVTIQRSRMGQGDVGQPKATWPTLYSGKGRIEPLSESERVVAGREGSAATHRIFCPASWTGMTHNDRAVVSSVTYDIVSVFEMPGATKIHHIELTVVVRK